MSDDFFALPRFDAATSLTQLKRQLRDIKPLVERAGGFEWNGRPVLSVAIAEAGDALVTRLARRRAMSPEWDQGTIKSSADLRKFVDAVKARISAWADED